MCTDRVIDRGIERGIERGIDWDIDIDGALRLLDGPPCAHDWL
jgi:hypothetical protein